MTKRFNLLHVIVGMLAAVILGFAFKDFIDDHLFGVKTVIFALVAGAILMIVADKFGRTGEGSNHWTRLHIVRHSPSDLFSACRYGQVFHVPVQRFRVVFYLG